MERVIAEQQKTAKDVDRFRKPAVHLRTRDDPSPDAALLTARRMSKIAAKLIENCSATVHASFHVDFSGYNTPMIAMTVTLLRGWRSSRISVADKTR